MCRFFPIYSRLNSHLLYHVALGITVTHKMKHPAYRRLLYDRRAVNGVTRDYDCSRVAYWRPLIPISVTMLSVISTVRTWPMARSGVGSPSGSCGSTLYVFQFQPIRTATVVSLSTRVTAEVRRDEVVFMTTFFQSGYFILQHKYKIYSIHTKTPVM